jgi:cytochrome c-type biogenesis protein CcmH
MMGGWVIMIGLSVVVFAALLFFAGDRKRVWSGVAAAITLATAGYAIQGRPSLPTASAKVEKKGNQTAEAFIAMRADMDQQYAGSKKWLVLADSFARNGNFRLSSALIKSGLKKNPKSADLWAAYGLVLMLAGDGNASQASEFAFAKARALSPKHPAPDYFKGLNALFNGKADKTLKLWSDLLQQAPKNAKWRPKLESQLAGLLAMLSRTQQAEHTAGQSADKP